MFNVLNLSRILLSLAVTSLLSSTTIQVMRGTSISVWASRVSSASCSSLHKLQCEQEVSMSGADRCVPGVGWRDHVQHDAAILLWRAVPRLTPPLLQAVDGDLHRGGELPAPDVHREEGDPGQEDEVQQGQSLSGALLGGR